MNRRLGFGDPLSDDIATDYHDAIQELPQLVRQFLLAPCGEDLTRSMAGAIAAVNGHILLADIMMELRPEELIEFYRWKQWKYHQEYLEGRNVSTGNDA